MGGSVASVVEREPIRESPVNQIDFALIGHQESWRVAADVLAVLRGPERAPLTDDEIKDILPWIPPRAVCHVEVGSIFNRKIVKAKARGLYIDSFIPPDRLGAAYVRENIARVRAAAACAINAGAKIVSLGGFSSILIEGNFDQLPERHDTVFTTGNTLTVGFVVQGVKKMCALEGRDLSRSTLLIVGATGDVGSGCARCLAPMVKRVLLSARNVERLRKLAAELRADGVQVEIATDVLTLDPSEHDRQRFSVAADVVICAASLASPALLLGRIAPDAIVCDAGYPKNLSPNALMPGVKVFFGGLGQITGGLTFAPDFHGILNRHPFPDVVHGCLLEGMALALDGRFESFSQGRGFITPERVEEMETIAARHGIYLAPLYNADGPVETDFFTEWRSKLSAKPGTREGLLDCEIASNELTQIPRTNIKPPGRQFPWAG
jgi:fatty aldehyde-generating acyl-ACP reductase